MMGFVLRNDSEDGRRGCLQFFAENQEWSFKWKHPSKDVTCNVHGLFWNSVKLGRLVGHCLTRAAEVRDPSLETCSIREEPSGVTGPHATQRLSPVPPTVVPDERCLRKAITQQLQPVYTDGFIKSKLEKSTGVAKTHQKNEVQAWFLSLFVPFNYGLLCDGLSLMSTLKFLLCFVLENQSFSI